jgi:hypothetical protein
MVSLDESHISFAEDKLSLKTLQTTGPFGSINPTIVLFRARFKCGSEDLTASSEHSKADVALLRRARDNRKGRNPIVVPRSAQDEMTSLAFRYTPKKTSRFREVGRNLRRMFTTFPYWDIAFGVSGPSRSYQ